MNDNEFDEHEDDEEEQEPNLIWVPLSVITFILGLGFIGFCAEQLQSPAVTHMLHAFLRKGG